MEACRLAALGPGGVLAGSREIGLRQPGRGQAWRGWSPARFECGADIHGILIQPAPLAFRVQRRNSTAAVQIQRPDGDFPELFFELCRLDSRALCLLYFALS